MTNRSEKCLKTKRKPRFLEDNSESSEVVNKNYSASSANQIDDPEVINIDETPEYES
jgi:hypothetical protein